MNLRKQLSSYIALNNYVEAIRGSQLPAGYTELEYIQSNGAQYIDTGVYALSNNVEIYLKTQLVGDAIKEKDLISNYGDGVSTSTKGRLVIGYYQDYIFAYSRNSSTVEDNAIVTPTNINDVLEIHVKYDYNNSTKTLTVNGISNTAPYTQGVSTDIYTLDLLHQKSGSPTSFFTGKLYNHKLIIDGRIVFNGIPAKNSSGTIGMYDTISGTFFTNSGTGSFVAGPEVSKSSVVLTDAIHNGLTGLQLKGSEVKNKPETFLDSVVAKGKTELRLPIERYDVLEYLEVANDSQYIKTNIVPDWTTKIDAKFRTGNDKTFTVLSRWTVSPTADTFGVIVSSTSSNIVSYFGRYSDDLYQNDVSFRLNANQDVVYKLSESSVQINEHNYSITRQNSGFENTLPLWIFKGNFLGEANAVNPTGSRVYYLQIKTQGNLVFDGVPVRRKSDGTLGIYDKVSGEFLTNASTGNFIAGNIIDTISVYLPEEYTWLDYLQSSGSQYIDIGRVPNNNDIIEQKFQKIGDSTATCAWYGSMPSASIITPRISIGSFSQANILTLFAGLNHTGAISTSDTNVHTLRFQATGRQELTYTLDGVTGVIDASTSSTPTDMFEPVVELTSYLFARHGTNGVQVYDNEGTKIYYHREYLANGTLVLNMIPVRRNSDNVLGMYDTVSGQFFTNQGTDSFIAGPEMVPTPTPSTPVGIWCNNGALKVNTTNLANMVSSNIAVGQIINDSGSTNASANNYYYIPFIPVKPDTSYVMYGRTKADNVLSAWNRICWYDANQTFISRASYTKDTIGQAVSPSNAAYARFTVSCLDSSSTITLDQILLYNWTFAESTTEIPYIPYKQISYEGITETLQDSTGLTAEVQNLLADGNYADEHSILDGTITRNLDVKVFNGTENWTQLTNNRGFFYGIPDNDACRTGVSLQSQQMYCTHFNFVVWPDNSIPMAVNSIGYNINGATKVTNGNITIRPDTGVYDTLEKWKAFLAEQYTNGTPVIVVRIAESTTETVSSQKLLKNPVIVTEASIDNLEVITTETEHTVPTPDYPLDIVCNNGVLKVGPNLFNADSSNITVGYWINNNTGEEQVNNSNFMINGYISVKPNTSYVAYGKRKTDNYLSQWNRIAWYDSDKNYISTSPYTQRTVGLGTSPSNAAYVRFSSNPTESTVTQDTVDSFNWTFREGTQEYSEFIPYNSVIVEGTPETITITGKNLLDINKTSGTGYLDTSGELVSYDDYYCSDYIEIKPSMIYTYTETMQSAISGNYIRFCFYDSNKTFISPRQGDTTAFEAKTYTYKITSPANAKYIRISSHSDFVKGQLEEDIRPTKYEEYYQESFVSEDLLKLGDYQDVQDVINGIKSKKIGFKVLDGTENWTASSTYPGSCYAARFLDTAAEQFPVFYCSHFAVVRDVSSYTRGKCLITGSESQGGWKELDIWYGDNKTTALTDLKTFLAEQYATGTPVIIVYPLADTVEETVESRDIFITSGTNTIERNSEYVSSGDITVGYKKLR